MDTNDSDLEVKEHALTVLGSLLLQQSRDHIPPEEIATCILPLLVEKLKHELTRIPALRLLNKIIQKSPSLAAPIAPAVITECVACMRQSQRQLLLAALSCLSGLLDAYPDSSAEHLDAILAQGVAVLTASTGDPAVFGMLLALLVRVLNQSGGRLAAAFKQTYMQPLTAICTEHPHIFSGSGVLAEFGRVWRVLVQTGSRVSDGTDMVRALVGEMKEIVVTATNAAGQKQMFPVFAFAIVSACCFPNDGDEEVTLPNWVAEVQHEVAGQVYKELMNGVSGNIGPKQESEMCLGLLILGEIGQRMYTCCHNYCLGIFFVSARVWIGFCWDC